MSLFSTPEDNAANPPETWQVRKAGERVWEVTTADGGRLDTTTTRRAAEELTRAGWLVNAYRKEARWYAGDTPHGWRPWLEVKAEQDRNAAVQAERVALRAAGRCAVRVQRDGVRAFCGEAFADGADKCGEHDAADRAERDAWRAERDAARAGAVA